MSKKNFQFDDKALKVLAKGAEKLKKTVKAALGPCGRNVFLRKGFNPPIVTKSGSVIARCFHLKDPFENLAAKSICEAALKTETVSGDGVKTTILLAEKIFSEGIEKILSGCCPVKMKKGIRKAAEKIFLQLEEMSEPLKPEEIDILVKKTVFDSEAAEILSEIFQKGGEKAVVKIEKSKNKKTYYENVNGLKIHSGYLSSSFITDKKTMTVEMDHPFVLIMDSEILTIKKLVPILEKVMEKGPQPFLLITNKMNSEVLSFLVLNKEKGNYPIAAVSCPEFGIVQSELLEDLSFLTGGTYISDDNDLIKPNILGKCEKVAIFKDETFILQDKKNSEELKKRIQQIQYKMNHSQPGFEKKYFQERIARLTGSFFIIYAGGSFENEIEEKVASIENAYRCVKSAVKEGVLSSGAAALSKAADSIFLSSYDSFFLGMELVKKACSEPIKTIASNCDEMENFLSLNKVKAIDSLHAVKFALLHAVSVASLLLNSSVLIVEKNRTKEKSESISKGRVFR